MVPHSLDTEEKMKCLYYLYACLDTNAVKSVNLQYWFLWTQTHITRLYTWMFVYKGISYNTESTYTMKTNNTARGQQVQEQYIDCPLCYCHLSSLVSPFGLINVFLQGPEWDVEVSEHVKRPRQRAAGPPQAASGELTYAHTHLTNKTNCLLHVFWC